MVNVRKPLAIVMALACLAGCGTKQFVKTYEGTELPPEQLALVKPVVGIDVLSVDGHNSYGVRTQLAVGYADVDMAVTPGRHSFVVSMRTVNAYSLGASTIELDAQPGHKYLITGSPDSPSRFKAIFEDVTDKPDRYCAQAGSRNFTGCSNVVFK